LEGGKDMAFPHEIEAIYQQRGLGIRVERAAAADVPNTVWTNIFTIAGGIVCVTALIGVRTVAQTSGGASNMQFRHSVNNTVLDAVLDVQNDTVNTIYTITGTPADALQRGLGGITTLMGMAGGLLATGINMFGRIMFTGNIQVAFTAADHAGSTRYMLYYIPLDLGAYIVAA
jgi:hypothetical protein